ncbi:MAG: hypothetical protein J5939_01460 [Bacteroidales bacterium]|nr:hypothetical protein [Bacteroidales bacterium]
MILFVSIIRQNISSMIVFINIEHLCNCMGNVCNRLIKSFVTNGIRTSFLFLMVVSIGCNQLRPEKLSNFPVKAIDDIAFTGSVIPRLKFKDINVNSFAIVDTFIVSYQMSGSNFISLYSLNSGKELGSYCRKGRGPGENLAMMPFFQPGCRADELFIFDASRSVMQTWNIQASVVEGKDVCFNSVKLNKGRGDYMSLLSLYKLNDGTVLAYDACQARAATLSEIPRYWRFDAVTGEVLDSIKCFKSVPLILDRKKRLTSASLMTHASCLDFGQNTLFLAMMNFPQVTLIDIDSGEAKGFILRNQPKQDPKKPYYYFSSVSATKEFVFCLYFGEEARIFLPLSLEEERSRECKSSLFVFDWDGNLCAKYLLDNVYERCQVMNDQLYLTRMNLEGSSLYTIPLSEIEPSLE